MSHAVEGCTCEICELATELAEERTLHNATREALAAVRAWVAQEEEVGVFVPTLVYQIIDAALGVGEGETAKEQA